MHGLQLDVDELERPGQGDADAPEEQREPRLGVLAERVIERRPGGQGFEDGPQFDLLLEALERVRALLQPLGDRQVPGPDDVADVRLRRGLADEQQVIQRVVDEIEVVLDVVPVDVDAAGGAVEALELGKPITGIAVAS